MLPFSVDLGVQIIQMVGPYWFFPTNHIHVISRASEKCWPKCFRLDSWVLWRFEQLLSSSSTPASKRYIFHPWLRIYSKRLKGSSGTRLLSSVHVQMGLVKWRWPKKAVKTQKSLDFWCGNDTVAHILIPSSCLRSLKTRTNYDQYKVVLIVYPLNSSNYRINRW